jgi:hypothetical protein
MINYSLKEFGSLSFTFTFTLGLMLVALAISHLLMPVALTLLDYPTYEYAVSGV